MGGCTVAEDMYESGVKITSMGGEEHPVEKAAPPSAELPEPEGEVIHIVLVETPEKNSTPPDYKPNTTSSAPSAPSAQSGGWHVYITRSGCVFVW